MKLSNKILIGFFGFIFFYLTAALAELRLTGSLNAIDDTNSIAETVALTDLGYVVINDFYKNIEITSSDRPRLEVRSFSGDVLKTITHRISGDTLTLNGTPDENSKFLIRVFVPATFKGIIVNNSTVTVRGLQQESLHVTQNKARIWMSGNAIASIHIDASGKSYLEITEDRPDTVNARIRDSQIYLYAPLRVLQGEISNAAYLRVVEADDIRITKDRSSALQIY